MLKQKEQGLLRCFHSSCRSFPSLSMRIITRACCADYMSLHLSQVVHTADRRFVFMLLLLSFGFASAVAKHNTPRTFTNPGFTKPPTSCRVERCPHAYQDQEQMRATSLILQEGCGSLWLHAWESYSGTGSVPGTSVR